jgi:hypothetical protein
MSVSVNRRVRSSLSTTNATPATGISGTYKYRKRKGHDILRYSAFASGTFTATVKLEVSEPDTGVWIDVPSGEFTAETSGTFVPGNDCDLRWNCTAYTAGPIVVTIG